MANESSGRRNWIKNVAIIFLVILLLLTFFSKTILDHSLPEVSAQYAQYATLSSSVKVSGTVKANASYNVVYEADAAEAEGGTVQSRKVISVFVKEGDTVEKDAPILSLKGGASDQLSAVQKEYDALKREYDLALLTDSLSGMEADKTLDDAKKKVQEAKDDLADLKKELEAVKGGVDVRSILEDEIEKLEDRMEDLNESLADANEKVSEIRGKISSAEAMIEEDVLSGMTVAQKLAFAESDYAAMDAAYNEAKTKTDEAKAYLERVKSSSGDIGAANELTNTIRTLEDQLTALEKQADRAYEDYIDDRYDLENQIDKLLAQYDRAYDDYLDALWEYNHAPMEQIIEEATKETDGEEEEGLSGGYSAGAGAEPVEPTYPTDQLDSLNGQLDALDKAYRRQEEDYSDQIAALERQIRDAQDKLDIIGLPEVDDVIDYATNYDLADAQTAYDEASAALTEITAKYEESRAKVESLRKQNSAQGVVWEYSGALTSAEAAVDSLKDQIKQLQKQIDSKNKELGKAEEPKDPKEVEDQIKEQEKTIADLEYSLAHAEASQNKTDTQTDLERADQKKRLLELEETIASYENAPETTDVTAPIGGRIVSVNFVPGDTVTSGNTVASIEIADKGYVVEVTMAAEEARKIQVGSPCTVSNSWWYSNVEAAVTQIRSDPQSQGKNRIIVIEVRGDVYEGQSLKFSIGDKSQSYDTVLPNSAIRQDSDGNFVLSVESKKTPLGLRYTAKRIEIEVLASDDTQSAVSGLYGSEFIITNSTSPISDKQQVRLAEN